MLCDLMKPYFKEHPLPEMRLQAVNAWSLNRLNTVLDANGMWLTDEAADAVVATLGCNWGLSGLKGLDGLGFKLG